MVDTCCDPTPIDYVIPANDDAAKSIAYIMDVLCAAVAEGLSERKMEKEKETVEQSESSAPAGKKLRSRKAKAAEETVEAAAESAEKEAAPVAEEAPKTEAPVAEPAAEAPAKAE